jgi:hypothetical protein
MLFRNSNILKNRLRHNIQTFKSHDVLNLGQGLVLIKMQLSNVVVSEQMQACRF